MRAAHARSVPARAGDCSPCRRFRSRALHAAISASAFWRHVPARHDRDGARHLAATSHRRRANHGPRRIGRCAHPRSASRPQERRTGTAILLITHDLGVVAQTCQRVAVMHAGQLVETAPVRELFALRLIPIRARSSARSRASTSRRIEPVPGTVPSLRHPPRGCRYAERCPQVEDCCRHDKPRHMAVGQITK